LLWVSYYVRFVFPLLFVVAVARTYARVRQLPFSTNNPSGRDQHDRRLILVFLGAALWAVRGSFYSGDPVHLAWPLENGTYYVGQGGGSSLVNYQYSHRSGNTSEPHLHIHAERVTTDTGDGDGVPMLFDGRFAVRNTIFSN